MGGRRKNRVKRKGSLVCDAAVLGFEVLANNDSFTREAMKNEHHLTLAQEARNTEQHSIFRHPSKQLRYNQIQFVSGGEMRPVDFPIREASEGEGVGIRRSFSAESDHSPPFQGSPAASVPMNLDVDQRLGSPAQRCESDICNEAALDALYFLDPKGDDSQRKSDFPNPVIRCDSLDQESSSEDEVVFAGRRSLRQHAKLPSDGTAHQAVVGVRSPAIEESVCSPSVVRSNGCRSEGTRAPISHSPNQQCFEKLFVPFAEGKKHKGKRRDTRHSDDEDLEAIMDYIQHMDGDSDSEDTDSDADITYQTPISIEIAMNVLDGKDTSLLAKDPPDPSTTGVSIENPTEERVNTAEYSHESDVNVLLAGNNGEQNGGELPSFDSLPCRLERVDSTDTEDIELLPNFPDDISADDLAELRSLLDLDGEDSSISDGTPDYQVARGKKRSAKTRKRNRNINPFLTATQFADLLDDDYGDFDIMDFERPSLKKGKSREIPNFGLSDSDLEWQMQSTWEADRAKKKLKKREREELRSLGLLTKTGKADLKVKYANGIDPLEIKDEIRQFLLSDIQSLSLPPMPKKERKLVHEMANALSLKSISRGNGASRFPVLTKTKHTPGFNSRDHGGLDALLNKGRIMRRYGKRNGALKRTSTVKSRGGAKSAAYNDGDVVGASAPEIASNNRGRAMLERMGWNTGTPLGAQNNKGILHPVVHVVKTSKAGLG